MIAGKPGCVTLEDALDYYGRGWSIIPVKAGTKEAAGKWKQYQSERPTQSVVRNWFGGDDQTGIGLILGKVSGDIVCRDFDDEAKFRSYEKWAAEHPDLAATLPTAKTPSGFHVFARVQSADLGFDDFEDGEYRGTPKQYVLLSPSVVAPTDQKPGGRYQWLIGLPSEPEGIPIIDPTAGGFRKCFSGAIATQENGDCYTRATHDEHRTTQDYSRSLKKTQAIDTGPHAARRGSVLNEAIELAIAQAIPTGRGKRHKMVFELARELKAIPELADATLATLKPYVKQWHRASLSMMSTKEFADSWLDFVNAWPRVKYPKTGEEILPMLLSTAKASTEALPPEAADYTTPKLLWLVSLCRELQRFHGADPFFLSCRSIGELLAVDHNQAARWLKVMQVDGILELVEAGEMKKRHASSYRYKASA